MNRHAVYGLVDPLTHELRYVGKTSTGYDRPRQHAAPYWYDGERTRHLHKYCWIRRLAALGHRPEVVEIEESSPETLDEDERFWIEYFRSIGCRLTNHTAGGDGPAGFRHREATRLRVAAKMRGRHHTPEARARISAAVRARHERDRQRRAA